MSRNGLAVTVTNPEDMSGSTATSPSYERSVGSDNINTGQNASSTNSAAAVQIVAARAGRRSVTVTNITGSQPVYLGGPGVTASNGFFLAGTVGAAVTIPTTAAISALSTGAAQTLAYVETF